MRKLLCFVSCTCILLFTTAALGASSWTKCDAAGTSTTIFTIKQGQILCYQFTADEDSGVFAVAAESALICLNPAADSDGVSNAEVMIRRCHAGFKPDANPEYQCGAILDASLTGATGGPASQNMCERVGPGSYYLDVTTSAGGDTAVVSIEGE